MSSTWLIYSGALMMLLSAGIMVATGRPATPVRRDTVAIATGVAVGVLMCVIALMLHTPARIAVSGSCFWMAAAITGTHAVRGRFDSRG
ncbi:hypothetical protein [Streptomyces sp. NPDC054863]